ncbi:MAG: DNA polymerase III subunit beta [bacterium]|nr:DNA polymerase III subunit beta [bacterium]
MLKAKIEKSCLASTLQAIMRAVSNRSTQPILGNTLIEFEEGHLLFTGTDLEIGLKTAVKAQVESNGSVTVPAKLLYEIISNLPGEEIELCQEKEHELLVKQGKSKYSIRTLPASEYPLFPELEKGDICEIPAAILQQAIRQVIFASSQDETRPILTGVLLEVEGNNINLAATDGHRLALRSISLPELSQEQIALIIPERTFNELSRLLSSGEGEVVIRVLSNQVAFIYNKIVLVSRIIEGKYPNYRQVIPGNLPSGTVASRDEITKAVKGAHILAKEGSHVVKMSFSAERIAVTAVTQDVGDVYEEINAQYDGEDMDIAFNARYLLDILGNLDEEIVEIKTGTPLSPAIIRPVGKEGYTYVVMPVKMG